MSAVIIRSLLTGSAELIAQVPESRILCAAPAQSPAAPPALVVSELACIPEPALGGQAASSLVTGQVQVSVVSADYARTKELVGLVRRACNLRSGQFAGLEVVRVVHERTGPDFSDPAGMPCQAIEFGITYYEPN
jgi:hypothetical protein